MTSARKLATGAALAAVLAFGLPVAQHAAVAATAPQPGGATTGSTPPAGPATSATAAGVMVPDLAFMLEAARIGQGEIALGKLAVQQAKDAKVKSFAQEMIKDHGEANQALMKVASAKGVDLPQDLLGPASQAVSAALGQTSGAEFDQGYIGQQAAGHEAAVALFRFASQHAMDPDVKAFAKKYEPVIAKHLQMAQDLMHQTMAAHAGAKAKGAAAGSSAQRTE